MRFLQVFYKSALCNVTSIFLYVYVLIPAYIYGDRNRKVMVLELRQANLNHHLKSNSF